MRKFLIFLGVIISLTINAQNFDNYFIDKTLRIDYNFSGNVNHQSIAVDELNVIPRWYGKRNRLAELPVEGNGQITVRDHHSGKVIYRNSFSTLFQEWLSYDEAKTTSKSFENVFLIPMPKDTVDITLDLRNNRRQVMVSLTHQVTPTDILIRHIGEKNITPYITLQQATDTCHCIHIAYIAEGYTPGEMNTFIKDAKFAMESLFSYQPFKKFRDRFNIVAVEAPSKESGTSEPSKGIWKNTALHSHFDTFYSDRYLTTLHLKDLHNWLAGIPYEHIIILVNTDKYGGGGILNSYNLSMTHHKAFRPVVVHEFGHSFAGLADEYAYDSEQIPMYPHDVEPWEKNITTKVNFVGKWENLIGKKDKKIGFYEGAGYSIKGVYRAYPDCRMRTNEYPEFCPACQQAITQIINFYTK
ncbi:MAG TPA: peptidase M64 [Prevotella sp.]|nr:peptidase M64 [Prevotella sp.]